MNHVMICIRGNDDSLQFGLVERPGSTKYRVRHPKFYLLVFRHHKGRIMIMSGEDDSSPIYLQRIIKKIITVVIEMVAVPKRCQEIIEI